MLYYIRIARIIILNGSSSSGKSSIAREMQKMLSDTFLHYPLDAFLNIDTVSIDGSVARMRECFKTYVPFMVGVKASPEILDAREKARGDRELGLAASQIDHVHRNIVYDFEIDTSNLKATEAAQKIIEAYLTARP